MLTDTIKNDMKEAMKARDDLKVQTLRGAMSAFTNELVAKNKKPTDQLLDTEVVTVLKRLAKQRKDSAEQFEKGDRHEMAQKELKELTIIEGYLPQGASREEIEKVARTKKEEMNADAAGKGKLMGAVIKAFDGNADGAVVKEVIDSLFS
ncbi:MAG: GatB/YqeY domain-containing protein [Minisyncoccia bacterium]